MTICEHCGEPLEVTQMVSVVAIEAREVTGFNEDGNPIYGEITTEDSDDTQYDRTFQCRACGCEITEGEAKGALK
jgi:hypothetical protein